MYTILMIPQSTYAMQRSCRLVFSIIVMSILALLDSILLTGIMSPVDMYDGNLLHMFCNKTKTEINERL